MIKFPYKEKCCNLLEINRIQGSEYEHALRLWKVFNKKNIGCYHDLSLNTDVELLFEVI